MKCSKQAQKCIASLLIAVLSTQLVLPNVALALTSGPSQPEVQSFEPVGTTDMVDMFSGDFVYNIPLMDVEGYPINIAYHGGVTMEQEASWVGLGWNINPGVINRTVRGIPDEFNGTVISKELHIKDESTLRVGLGVGGEQLGDGDPKRTSIGAYASAGVNLTFNNYRGTSADFSFGGGIKVQRWASAGVNIGVGSQTGAEIDLNGSLQMSISQKMSKDIACTALGVGIGGGYSTRAGLRALSFSPYFTLANASSGTNKKGDDKYMRSSSTIAGNMIPFPFVPISLQNYVPVITNSSTLNSIFGRLKFGGELSWCYGYTNASGMYSVLHYNDSGSRPAYGYLNMHKAGIANDAILDFTRDKDGLFNKSMQYLPLASMTYDIYSVSGQGTGGVFRPFRNDFVSVYDPATSSNENAESYGLEAGLGSVFEAGADYNRSGTEMTSGPWMKYLRPKFDSTSKIYERTYFKQGGELTASNPAALSAVGGIEAPITPDEVMGLPDAKPGTLTSRDVRANLIYSDGDGISQLTQLQKDGTRYVYGATAVNNVQKEVTFSVDPPNSTDLAAGLVDYTIGTDDAVTNGKGKENYYNSSVIPAYAHSFLLTSVLSPDYVDVTGDGISDDDLGSYTKFGYTTTDPDFRWKSPYAKGKAQYDPGYWSDTKDDKGSYICGSRRNMILHTVETKNFIAEFYTSQRDDARGTNEKLTNTTPYNDTLPTASYSYKLDSIKLFNKHDRLINDTNAVPIKTVMFVYDYSLCTGVPNSDVGGTGKLTLKRIYFRYGNSQKSMLSPYQFNYGYNPNYDLSNKDRWSNYKPNNPACTNYEYPYVDQNNPAANDSFASAWSLTTIQLPSGGKIEATYESDDYAYVQDKQAAEMFKIQGIGNSPYYNSNNSLYMDEHSPFLYTYFQRRTSSENPSLSFEQNYLKDKSCMYFNFNLQLRSGKNTFEQIKGYAEVESVGACPDGVHGYIKFRPVTPTGGGAELNPATYIAINTARYNLPHIIYPGSDPDMSDAFNILTGLISAFGELVSIRRSPVVHLVKQDDAKYANLNKSFVRLNCVGLRKKGGGQRIKQLTFSDSWTSLAGGNSQDGIYGKQYDYTIDEPGLGKISSGVACYEPLIGGDENPHRRPVSYTVASGSNFPPNDPIDLYQELPIGESLYPPAMVGYRKVTVTSIHADIGKSSQVVDVYQFYTAKDYPVKFHATALDGSEERKFGLFEQKNTFQGTQSYSLVFNDMHGKPKSIEHYTSNKVSSALTPISSQFYYYKGSPGNLDNTVNCLVYSIIGGMHTQSLQVGVETDITLDTREKTEKTKSKTTNTNLNVAGFAFAVIPIPLIFSWKGEYLNRFRSATVTKVTQQYGILDHVISNNEGAITKVTNEIFDPESGNVVVTSVNNEYNDKEYSVDVPAWWCYIGMGTAYNNINFETTIDTVIVDTNYMGTFTMHGSGSLYTGDEMHASVNGLEFTCWFMGSVPNTGPCHYITPSIVIPNYEGSGDTTTNWTTMGGDTGTCCTGFILPRFPKNLSGWTPGSIWTGLTFKVTRPGPRNMLNQSIANYRMLDNPIDNSRYLKRSISNVISFSERTYSDSNTRILTNYITNPDTINPYAIGERGVFHPLTEYSFIKKRDYLSGATSRNSGLFTGKSLFAYNLFEYFNCNHFPYRYLAFDPIYGDEAWKASRTITKWSPNGKEVENVDAVGNFSTAVYGYNQELPVAVASNAKQGEVLTECFEDYKLLQPEPNYLPNNYSPFLSYFGITSYSTPYSFLDLSGSGGLGIVKSAAHTGLYSLSVPSAAGPYPDAFSVTLPINNNIGYAINRYNFYFPYGTYNVNCQNEYLPFKLNKDKKYILSYWIRQVSPAANTLSYTLSSNWGVKIGSTLYPVAIKSNIIEGWQQVETTFKVSSSDTTASITLPVGYYVDDIRIFPTDANMKSFVYNPINEKLMSTLDENNFATFYEYDQEGNLVRTKKETEKGIITVSESRNANPRL